MGKTPGKDLTADKSTYVKLLGLSGAKAALAENLADATQLLTEISDQTQMTSDIILRQIERLRID